MARTRNLLSVILYEVDRSPLGHCTVSWTQPKHLRAKRIAMLVAGAKTYLGTAAFSAKIMVNTNLASTIIGWSFKKYLQVLEE